MIDLHVPTTDGRELILTRYTEPEPELALLLNKLKLELPAQPSPRITATQVGPEPSLKGRPSGSQLCYLRYLPPQNGPTRLSQAKGIHALQSGQIDTVARAGDLRQPSAQPTRP